MSLVSLVTYSVIVLKARYVQGMTGPDSGCACTHKRMYRDLPVTIPRIKISSTLKIVKLTEFRSCDLCESRGGRPGLSVIMSLLKFLWT